MKKNYKLPSLKTLFGSWKEDQHFYFFERFLTETRQCVGGRSSHQKTEAKSIWPDRLKQFIERVGALTGLVSVLLCCIFAPKGLPVIFNHSSRLRKDVNGERPLYLAVLLEKQKAVVFEDSPINFRYVDSINKFQSCKVVRASQIISAVLIRLYGKNGIADRDIATFKVSYTFWRLIFLLLRPSCVRLIVWYGKEAVVAAAKSLGVEIVDVQHGVVYPSHPFYNVKSINEEVDRGFLLPDKCFVYGEYWRTLLIEAGWHPDRVEVVGYFLDILPCQSESNTQKYVLYTSQPHSSEIIIAHIRSIHSSLKSRGMRAIIARHPAEDRDLYDGVLDDVVQIVEDWDSYDLLRYCEVHVSVSSTLLWEAVRFGKSSYVLNYGKEAVDMLEDFLAFGFGKCIKTGAFPEPFKLPQRWPVDYFFSRQVNSRLIFGL